MYDFEYHKPASVDAAVSLLASQDDYKPLAGGMSLIPALKMRLARYGALVDLGGIDALRGVRISDKEVTVGAMTPHVEVAESREVQRSLPALATLASGIGDPLVRNRGTLGGSIANADPAADYPAAVLGLAATVVTNRREIAADDFFLGLFETALAPGELIVAVRFPIPQAASYLKLPQAASRFALVGVFVAKTAQGVRVAVTGAGPSVFRFSAAEAALAKSFDPAAAQSIELSPDGLNSDLHGSAEYRANCVAVMTRRGVAQAIANAKQALA